MSMEHTQDMAARIVARLDADTPGPIFCADLFLLFRLAFVLHPEDMQRELGRWMVEKCRTSSGLCSVCGVNGVHPSRTHPPHCEQCDARIAAEVAKYTDGE